MQSTDGVSKRTPFLAGSFQKRKKNTNKTNKFTPLAGTLLHAPIMAAPIDLPSKRRCCLSLKDEEIKHSADCMCGSCGSEGGRKSTNLRLGLGAANLGDLGSSP